MERSPTEEAPRILVVDDEEVIRELLEDFLSMEGFSVKTAGDGREAVGVLSRERFDLVLSDMKMPDMGGLELLEAVRVHTPELVFILMTGFGTVETAIHAMKKGAYDYILKPFKIEDVVLTLQRGLRKRKLEAENLRLREALSLYKVSEAIASSLSLDGVMHTIADAALTELGADRIDVLLDDGQGSLFLRVHEERPGLRESTAVPEEATLGDLDPAKLAFRFITHSATCLLHGEKAEPLFREPPTGASIESLVAVPLRLQKRTLGYLVAMSYTPNRRFSEGQRKLLVIVANRAAAAIENAKLYEDLQATFRQTIKGLASAIDKMDRYTAGHSERVAAYSQVLAIKLGLPEEEVEIVRQAALMHDIGKIGCVMNLNKPGKLSQEEYEVFKQHPDYGRDILDPITFLHPLIPGVYMHHERWDGRGYPLGLSAQEIPLIARIISVADAYDAMTSDRAYRRALPHEVAIGELERCTGTQFDPDCAHPFLEALEEDREDKASRGVPIPE